MSDPYTFSSLASPRSIRLLFLEPTAAAEELSCTLKEVSIDDGHTYEALSYEWGEQDPTGASRIVCSGKTITITPNCKAALEFLRQPVDPRALWVDAICIDQTNLVEKSHQIPLMGNIYENASVTIMWLGKDPLPAPAASATAEAYAGKLNADQVLVRTYFQRLWTLQEAALSKRAVLMSETVLVAWSDVVKSFLPLKEGLDFDKFSSNNFPGVMAHVDATYLFNIKTRIDPASWPSTLRFLLKKSRGQKTAEPKDRVFALQAMFDAFAPGAFRAPDYGQSKQEIHTDNTRTMICLESNLRICRNAPSLHHDPQLPSWVPDWNDRDLIDWPPRQFCVDANPPPSLPNISTSADELQVPIKVLGVVTSISTPAPRLPPIQPQSQTLVILRLAQEFTANLMLWSKIVRETFTPQYTLAIPRAVHRDLYCKYHTRLHIQRERRENEPRPGMDFPNWAAQMTELSDPTMNIPLTSWALLKPEDVNIAAGEWELLGRSLLYAYGILKDQQDLLMIGVASGLVGFARSADVQAGDKVALLPGANAPAMLRPEPVSGKYRLIGFAWIFGFMHELVWDCATEEEVRLV